MNGINGGVNGINGHSRTVSDSTSFDDDDFDLKTDASARDMDLSFERAPAPAPAEASESTPRNPSFAERDAQSARASGLIGNMLLRGFALLADSCPNSTCYGIPLVGHPRARRAGGGRDAGLEDIKKECVICHRVYNREGELIQGGSTERVERPAPAAAPVAQTAATSVTRAGAPDSPRTIARRALYAEGEKVQQAKPTALETAPPPVQNEAQPSTGIAREAPSRSVSCLPRLWLLGG
jgi:hypothetical protein